MTRVRIPPTLRVEVGGEREVEASGSTLREVIDDLVGRFPGLGRQVLEDGEVAEDASDIKATWLFGDGAAVEGPKADFTFEKPGVFPVAVTLDDGGGLASSRRTEEVYVRVNQAPVAQAGPDRIVCPGDPVAFDAGLSADGDGTLMRDTVRYSVGFGPLGELADRLFVARDVAAIFDFRAQATPALLADRSRWAGAA